MSRLGVMLFAMGAVSLSPLAGTETASAGVFWPAIAALEAGAADAPITQVQYWRDGYGGGGGPWGGGYNGWNGGWGNNGWMEAGAAAGGIAAGTEAGAAAGDGTTQVIMAPVMAGVLMRRLRRRRMLRSAPASSTTPSLLRQQPAVHRACSGRHPRPVPHSLPVAAAQIAWLKVPAPAVIRSAGGRAAAELQER